MKTDFEAFVENGNASEAHSQEIKATRIGGLGGSDAAMVLKIGKGGLSTLSNSDLKRLSVMWGLSEQEDWGGNSYTRAGHKFEDWCETNIPFGTDPVEREKMMEAKLARNFKTFAHADFVYGEGLDNVVECKYVNGKDTDKVISTYYAQLQWYYMLGAKNVHLMHGVGSVDDEQAGTVFHVDDAEAVLIERDEDAIKLLKAGIKTLDKALESGWVPVVREKSEKVETPLKVQEAFEVLASVKDKRAELNEKEAEAKEVLQDYMDAFSLQGVIDTESKRQVVYVAAKTTTKFDLKMFKDKIMKKAEGESNVSLTLEQIMATIEEAQKTSVTGATIMFK